MFPLPCRTPFFCIAAKEWGFQVHLLKIFLRVSVARFFLICVHLSRLAVDLRKSAAN